MIWKNLPHFYNPHHIEFWLAVIAVLSVFVIVMGRAVKKHAWNKLGDDSLLSKLVLFESTPVFIVRTVLILSTFILLLFAAARPQTDGKSYKLKPLGLDIVVALDFSKSMNVRDMQGSRLEQAKREMSYLVDELGGDRVGLVAFAGTTMSYPLTTDYESAKMFWADLTPDDMPVGGTAIGKALNAAKNLLTDVREPGKERAQIIILISDGEDLSSKPVQVADELKNLGIKVYTVGIGSSKGALIPIVGNRGQTGGYMKYGDNYVTSRLDESLLKQIANMTGGQYFRASKSDFGTAKIIKAIKDLKRTEGEKRILREKNEEFYWFLIPAMLLLLIEFLILGNATVFGRKESYEI